MSSTTASKIVAATQIITERAEQWRKEHPGEQMEECPKCRGTGLIRYWLDYKGDPIDRNARGAYEYLKPCSCVSGESQKTKNDRKFAAVPGLYRDARFENFSETIYKDVEGNQLAASAKHLSQMYVEHFPKMLDKGIGFYIWSQAKGSGKSRLASTISNELTDRGFRNKFVSANTILSEIQSTWDEKGLTEKQVMRPYLEASLLIIDDFGARSKRDWIDERMFWLIDSRYQEYKPTIITSNYEVDELPLDPRIVDRLEDVDRFVNIKMPRISLRKKTRSDSVSEFYKALEED